MTDFDDRPFDDTAAAVDRVADELTRHQQTEGNLTFELSALSALQLATLLQVTVQAAQLPAAHRALAAALFNVVERYFDDCPAVQAVLATGFPTNTRH